MKGRGGVMIVGLLHIDKLRGLVLLIATRAEPTCYVEVVGVPAWEEAMGKKKKS